MTSTRRRTITAPPATRSIEENSTVVATFSATEVDASDTLTWSVESTDDGRKFTFEIVVRWRALVQERAGL